MPILQRTELGAWLAERMGSWATVGGVAGVGFEAYARILHPVGGRRLDLAMTDEWGGHPALEERPWRWADVAARSGHIMHPLVQWRRLTGEQDFLRFPDGWSLDQSRDGWFDPALLATLTVHLRLATATPSSVVLGVWNGWDKGGGSAVFSFAAVGGEADTDQELDRLRRLEELRQAQIAASSVAFNEAVDRGAVLTLPGRNFVLLRASLDELEDPDWGYSAGIGWSAGDNHPTPQLIWPDDHAWCVASEIDWDFTLVAGPRTLINAILADHDFESFEVQETDDLSWNGDTINKKSTP